MKTKKTKLKPRTFDAEAFLNSTGMARSMREFRKKETLFSQGDPGKNNMYIQKGGVKISVVSKAGKEAVVGLLGPGDFIGEGGLAGQPQRMATATAVTPVSVLVIDNGEMALVLHEEHEFSDGFITYMLGRNIRIEEDLVDQLFNSARNGWRAPSCCSRDMANWIGPRPCYPRYPRRLWQKLLVPRVLVSISS